jgi:hypothetical protein
MPFITYPHKNGVAIIIPVDQSMSIEDIAKKDVPLGLPFKILNSLEINRDYRSAYEFDLESGIIINISKAKAIQLDKFREARKPKLEALDIAFMKAVEQSDTAKQAEISSQKQALRDVTKTPLPDTLPEIKATWPEILT